MKKLFITGLILLMHLCAQIIYAADLQDGFLGLKWRTRTSELTGYSKLREKGDLSYYGNLNKVFTIEDIRIPKVIYGFYTDRLFAVYLLIESPDAFARIRQYMISKYGDPKEILTMKNEQTIYNWRHGTVKIKLKRYEERLFKELTDYLTEINWLISLSRIGRNQYRELQEKLKKPSDFINSIITSQDQDRIYQFLNQYLKSRSNKNLEKQISWTNETTKISYTLTHRARFTRIKDKVQLNCFKNTLQVDLTNLYPVSLPNLKPNLRSNFCHIPPNDWEME